MLTLKFLGTRGEIKLRTPAHDRHSSLLILSRGKKIMVDCGEDWRSSLRDVSPDAIVITHAHPDHAWGLKDGSPCPVYAPQRTWRVLGSLKDVPSRIIRLRDPFVLFGVTFIAFPIEHSIRAPAVGYRIASGHTSIFYVPDVVSIIGYRSVLRGVDLYVGDGAAVTKSIIRSKDGKRFGHSSIAAQLKWCKNAGVRRAVFTHCGSEIVSGAAGFAEAKVRELGESLSVSARIAHDGEELIVE